MWKQIQKASDQMTPDLVAELMAVKWFSFAPADVRCPAAVPPGSPGAVLVRMKLVTAERVKGWGRHHRKLALTTLGEHVLFHQAEDAMLATGAMAKAVVDDDA